MRFALCSILIAFILLLAPMVFAGETADVYMEEKMEHSGVGMNTMSGGVIKSWISGNKLKQQNPGGNEIFIFRADLGKVYIINAIKKSYMEVPLSQMRALTEKNLEIYMPPTGSDGKMPESIYKKTGKTKTISKWQCYEVEVLAGQTAPEMQSKTTMWVTKNLGFGHDFVVRIFKITMGNEVSPKLQELFEKMTALDGYPVQTITTTTYRNQNLTSTKTLVKIEKKKKIEPLIFEVPAGYTKVAIPGQPQ